MSRCLREVLVCIALAALTAGAFAPALRNHFVNYDDPEYVTDNRHVQAGLSFAGVAWAFTTTHAANWHPLTWLSLQLDVTLYGRANAEWGCHLTNVVLHAAAVVLLFLALRRMTGALWPAAAVAAFFAVHPLRVESVAWVSERKDVLAALFGMLTLWAYARYAQRPSRVRYLLVILAFTLGLLSKPMLVTLPCVLLLLDYWPLRRWQTSAILEKLPLFLLSAAACGVTLYAQKQGQAVSSLDQMPLGPRLLNVPVAYIGYLVKTFWPVGLAAYYPHPGAELTVGEALRNGLLLAALTVLVVWARRCRYLAVGWLWYLGTLVPVIGLVQVGGQAMADRYTYVPHVGLFLMIAWLAADLTVRWPRRALALGGAAAGLLGLCVVLTRSQVEKWSDSFVLWDYTLSVTEKNWLAHSNLGAAYLGVGRLAEAVEHLSAAAQLRPGDAKVHVGLGLARLQQGRPDLAAAAFEEAVRLNPSLPYAHDAWGNALTQLGRHAEAAARYQEAVRLAPDYARAHNHLGTALARQGKFTEAVWHHEEAIRIDPGMAAAHNALGIARAGLGDWPGAAAAFRRAAELSPAQKTFAANLAWALGHGGQREAAAALYRELRAGDPDWLERTNETAWVRATHPAAHQRDAEETVRLAEQVCEASPSPEARYLDTLAAAYAEAGRFCEAAATARRALALCPPANLAEQIEQRLRLYEGGQPYRDQGAS